MKKIIPITLIVVFIDRITKILMTSLLKTEESITIIKNFFSFTIAKNTGVAFSLLEGQIPFIIISTLCIILFIVEYLKRNNPSPKETICYSFIIGGAIGNLIDRIIYGYVIDFIDFKIIHYDFPIFNIADSCIVIGIILLLIITIKEGGQNENEVQNRNRRGKSKIRQISNRKTRK